MLGVRQVRASLALVLPLWVLLGLVLEQPLGPLLQLGLGLVLLEAGQAWGQVPHAPLSGFGVPHYLLMSTFAAVTGVTVVTWQF